MLCSVVVWMKMEMPIGMMALVGRVALPGSPSTGWPPSREGEKQGKEKIIERLHDATERLPDATERNDSPT